MKREKILVVGTGAMASLFAARLTRVAEVTLLGTWEAGLAALETQGVRLVEINGAEESFAVRVARSPEACTGAKMAIVLVKAWQTHRAADQLGHCLHPQGIALTLQNGLGNREILEETLGVERVGFGVTTAGATILEPGRVRSGGKGPIYFRPHPSMTPLVELLAKAGFVMEPVDDVQGLLWSKLVINTGINPLTALLEVPNGTLLESPSIMEVMVRAAEETAAVAAALDVQLPFADPGAQVKDVARRTGENTSSMLQDIRRGAPTEIDAINGAVVREGEGAGISTPTNWTLWHLVQGKVKLKQGRDK
ncbi:MAG TPA: 2-dehydropantoate 2-reductase [Anaerolineales bacterium]|nr:2-dehydropantoate 2-reductase [Anaerolineales bacterium]HUS84784.1 2-dehydropantoate 2-reductase [Anaerolineales bacterium]